MIISHVDDADDPRVAPYVNVRERDVLHNGLFICEGKFILERLLAQKRFPPVSALMTPDRLQPLRDILAHAAEPFEVMVTTQTVMNRVAGYDVHRGILACARTATVAGSETDVQAMLGPSNHVAFVSGVANGENLGSILRNAAALGIDGVIIDQRSIHPLSRRSIRVSMGAALALPWLRVATITPAIGIALDLGYTVYGLTPSAPTLVEQTTFGERSAVVFGEEAHGLPLAALDISTPLSIPMARGVDSLNVAATSAIVFDAMRRGRQRSAN
jgi:tRNA G18 (ribose-2'-O)-methylase SpoU